jgi:CheY-like chemotaxis protein
MDLVMPVMDGLEAIRLMRSEPVFDQTVIIGASASVTNSGNKGDFINACDEFVIKPIRIDLLLEKIGARLGIEWETEEIIVPARDVFTRQDTGEMLTPPPAELDELLNLAMLGDMQGVEQWALGLEKKDARYRIFAGKLRELAGSFKTKAVLALVKQCRGEES